jgi:hypothetical protein
MIVNIKNTKRIEVIPENSLEDAVISACKWTAQVKDPEPLEVNVRRLVLESAPEDKPAKNS